MAIKKFNAVAGISVGENTIFEVIDSVANVSANGLSVSGVSSLGPASNVKITGGTSGYVLSTDGLGNLSWINNDAGPSGSNTQIQFNNNGVFGGDANLTFNTTTDTLSTKNILLETTGNLSGGNLVSANFLTGTLTTASQPNITSLGTLTGLTSTGIVDFVNASNVSLGSVSNLKITGGTSGYVLKTDGAGNLSWGADTSLPGGTNTQVQFNDESSLGGSSGFTFDKTANALFLVGNITTRNANLGNLTTSNYFVGNGSLLTAINGSNVTGAVAYATTANSVAGANVTGAVAYATTANSVAGANVSGQVSYAAVANSVAGANVTGAVAYATTANSVAGANVSGAVAYATTANSVAVGNVSGIGNIATINLDGNSRNVLHGDGTWSADVTDYSNSNVVSLLAAFGSNNIFSTGNITANNFVGNAQGLANLPASNIVGQVANALVAGTVYTNAQPNITSLGTLTSLNVSGTTTITGNLTVDGTVANLSVGNLSVQDNLIDLSAETTGTPSNNAGLRVIRGDELSVQFRWNETSKNWQFTNDGTAYLNLVGKDSAGNISVSNANLGNLATANFFSGNGSLLTNVVATTVSTAAQPNITSLGTLTGLTVNGVSNLGLIGNVKITGGLPGYTIATDGAGNLTWTAATGGSGGGFTNINKDSFTGNGTQSTFNLTATPTSVEAVQVVINGMVQLESVYTVVGSSVVFSTPPLNGQKIEVTTYGVTQLEALTGQVTYANGGNFAGSNNFTFNGTTNTLSVTNITSTGNVSAGNIKTDSILYANGSPYVFTTNPAGSNTQIQFNDSNVFAASANLTFNKTSNTLTTYNIVAANTVSVTNGVITLDTGIIAVSSGSAGVFNSGVSNINFGLTSNITMGSATSLVTVQGNLAVANTATITNLKVSDFYSNRAQVVVTTNTIVDSFSVNKYRSAKYTMRVNSDDGYQTVEILLIHDNANSYVTIYGSLSTIGTDIISLSTDISAGNVRLLATTGSANTTVKLLGTYIAD
jgi:hypothetical protein